MKNLFNFIISNNIGEPPWERNFSRVMPPCSILGAQTRSDKKSAETLKNADSNSLWRMAL